MLETNYFKDLPGWYGVLGSVLDQFAGLDTVPHPHRAGGRLPGVGGHADDHPQPRPVRGRPQLDGDAVAPVLAVSHHPPDESAVN